MTPSTSVTRYVLYYVGVSLVLTAVSIVFSELTGIALNSGVSVGITIASALFAGSRFVTDQGRFPNTSERRRLTAYSFLLSGALSLAITGTSLWLLYGTEGLWDRAQAYGARLGVAGIAIIIAISVGLYYLVLWLAYGWVLRRALRNKVPS